MFLIRSDLIRRFPSLAVYLVRAVASGESLARAAIGRLEAEERRAQATMTFAEQDVARARTLAASGSGNTLTQPPPTDVDGVAMARFLAWLDREAPKGVKLYVQRVFITDQATQFLPLYLRFIKGVVDSNDLSLNVSREILQSGPVIDSMKSALTKRVLDMLEKLAKDKPEDYRAFWKSFGTVLKEGLAVDTEYREKLGTLVRYESSREEGLTSLADYVSRMKEGQKAIYYVFGESRKAVVDSPHLETLKKLTGLIYAPVAPLFYLPAKFKLRVLDPISFDVPPDQDRYSKSRIMDEAEAIRIKLQENLYDMLRTRQSVWFG